MNKEVLKSRLIHTQWDSVDFSKLNIPSDHKFLNRKRTLSMNIDRLTEWIPEMLTSNKRVLDVSCGSGASLEVLRCAGAIGKGLEFSPRSRKERALYSEYYDDVNSYSDYEPLLKSQNLDYQIHDCSKTPYPFEDKSFDAVINYGAITFYGDPEYWPTILNEFKRLSRDIILLGVNVGWQWDKGEKIIDEWSEQQKDLILLKKHRSTYKWKFKKF